MSDASQWIDAYLDGNLSAEDAESLRQWLRCDAKNVDAFVRHARLHWQLRDALAGAGQPASFAIATSALDQVKTRPASRRRWIRPVWLVAAAVVTLCLVGSFVLRLTRKPGASTGTEEGTSKTLATLISTDQAQWVDGTDRKTGRSIAGHLGLRSGDVTVRFADGAEVVLKGPCEFDVVSGAAGRLSRGQLVATVPPSARGFRVDTPSMAVIDLGTRFGLVVDASGSSDVHVLQGLVELSQGSAYRQQVTTGQAAHATAGKPGIRPAPFNSEKFASGASSQPTSKPSENPTGANPYEERFLSLWKALHEPKNGYFSASGLPYHSRETFIIEAPDYGHETTSEALSYWLWLEAKYGHLTGDWSKLTAAWDGVERYAIPTPKDQPTNRFYNPKHPASYAPEWETPDKYPAALRPDVPVGKDPIADELKRTYGTADVYGMHWLLDLDNWYGYGRRGDGTSAPAYINTFQRGPMESVWATVTHPSWETFKFGGPHGFLDLFIQDGSYSPQWRYTTAPDADARVVEAMYWAGQWAKQRGQQEQVSAAMAKAARIGDYLRYATFDKYFKRLGSHSERDRGGTGDDSAHHLIGWYYGWGGPIDPKGGWAFRIGCSHVHSGYQNPLAAWALAESDSLRPKSPHAADDWRNSLSRQMEVYRWLQSAEGAIAGGATNSWNGRYEAPPAGTPTFYGMAYDWEPVYHDPPSNDWFGFQAWTMCRVAELYFATGNKDAAALLDKWVPWATANVALNEDGTFLVPQTLRWSGQPESWDPSNPRANAGLHVEVLDRSGDVGVAASLARTLLYYSGARKHWAQASPASASLARQLLGRIWAHDRDDAGVSVSEPRPDYKRVFEQTVHIPPQWAGKMPNGDPIHAGVKFIEMRSKYRKDSAFAEVERAYRAGQAPVFRYHRFWAQVEVALANAALAELDTGGAQNP